MCHFLTCSVRRAAVPDVPENFRREVVFWEQNNPSISRVMGEGWVLFVAVAGMCSCGF